MLTRRRLTSHSLTSHTVSFGDPKALNEKFVQKFVEEQQKIHQNDNNNNNILNQYSQQNSPCSNMSDNIDNSVVSVKQNIQDTNTSHSKLREHTKVFQKTSKHVKKGKTNLHKGSKKIRYRNSSLLVSPQIMQNFSSNKLGTNRITIREKIKPGIFNKGKASEKIVARGVPDLVFSEIDFLNSIPSNKRKYDKHEKSDSFSRRVNSKIEDHLDDPNQETSRDDDRVDQTSPIDDHFDSCKENDSSLDQFDSLKENFCEFISKYWPPKKSDDYELEKNIITDDKYDKLDDHELWKNDVELAQDIMAV
ncbi:968_t:CDS:2 [Diversispora eburnea]|uniref:968_t:CDS:1 n=1 Tax=Diversispora eburnea TaxID=1213867 RepID=A0A9N8W249_9GLOM|nr:968_t:CDS:2 [Diversispora eburnea]